MTNKKQTRPVIPDEARKNNPVSILVEEDMRLFLIELAEAHAIPKSTLIRKILWDVVPDMVREVRGEVE